MRENINKVYQRGEQLDTLQDKTDNLAQSAQGFRRGANRVRKQMWWKDMKMRMCLIVGIIILLIVIIVPAGKFPRLKPRRWPRLTRSQWLQPGNRHRDRHNRVHQQLTSPSLESHLFVLHPSVCTSCHLRLEDCMVSL